MITVIVLMKTIPKFQRVELFLFNCFTQFGIPSNMKSRVSPSNRTIGKPIAINNFIKRRGFCPSNLDQLSTNKVKNRGEARK